MGLNQKEQNIYFALLQLEKATANQIATRANIKRPTTYDILYRLQKAGFISETVKNNKRYFIANPPNQLIAIIEEQKRLLVKDLPFLLSAYNIPVKKPKISYYEGFEGIIQLYEDTLATLKKGDEILAYVTNETPEAMPEYTKDYVARRVKKGISLRGIYNTSPEIDKFLSQNTEQLRTVKTINPASFPLKNEINIYSNKIIIITHKPSPFGIQIESNEVTQTQRTIFELAWQGLE